MFIIIPFVEYRLGSNGLLEYSFSLQYKLLSDKHCDLLPISKDTTFDNKGVEFCDPLFVYICTTVVLSHLTKTDSELDTEDVSKLKTASTSRQLILNTQHS